MNQKDQEIAEAWRQLDVLINELGMSRPEIANRIGVNHTSVWRWSRAEDREPPTRIMRRAIADLYHEVIASPKAA